MASIKEVVHNALTAIRQAGGIWRSLCMLYRTDTLKDGDLIGIDEFGNKYYQNRRFFSGRSRWVVYSDSVGLDYDASQIPPEWHRWIHQMTEDPPSRVPLTKRPWMIQHSENLSGTINRYVPYDTTKPKITAWKIPQK